MATMTSAARRSGLIACKASGEVVWADESARRLLGVHQGLALTGLSVPGTAILPAFDAHPERLAGGAARFGRYIAEHTGADMLMWNGECIVHDEFKGLELELMKREHPDALVLVHPESPKRVVELADVVGSTSQLLNAVVQSDRQEFIVATDNGILHRMRQMAPGKTLLEAPTAGNSATCKSCAHCPWMAMNALQGVVDCLERGTGEILVAEPTRGRALGCIERMLDFVKAHPQSIATPARGFVPNIGAA